MFDYKKIGSVALISGTSIGVGMLTLPVTTAESGFIPATLAFLVCYIFMTLGAIFILQVNMAIGVETNIISMAQQTLGTKGKYFTICCYVALLYAIISAYLKASSAWLVLGIHNFGLNCDMLTAKMVICLVFSITLLYGTNFVAIINKFLILGLVIGFILMISYGIPSIEISKLETPCKPSSVIKTLSIIITSFGCAIVVPSITTYLNFNYKSLKKIIVIGSLIPLISYIIWEATTLGVMPVSGPKSLQYLSTQNANGTELVISLGEVLNNNVIKVSGKIFAVFAILTSFLGVSISLFHFLADGLNLKYNKTSNSIVLCALIYTPPIIILQNYQNGIDKILAVGGVLVAILLGILPSIMSLKKPYGQGWSSKPLYKIITIVFFSLVIIAEICLH